MAGSRTTPSRSGRPPGLEVPSCRAFGCAVELKDLDEVFSLTAEIDRHRQHGWGSTVVDVVPGAATVLLDGVEDPAGVASRSRRGPCRS